MDQTLDPVLSPAAYQAYLLAALGSDDPATAQASTPARLRAVVADAGALLRVRPEPGEWSVIECLAHIVDGELVSSARYRWIVAQDEPLLIGYDQDRWVDRLHADEDPEILLGLFDGLRRANLDLWARIPVDQRARIGRHQERGPESYDLTFRLLAGHDRIHLAQAQDALAAVRRSR
ncbi:MAG TPA: DinB family protein [Candidatus Acidoferrum sp.]|nr:DinB family protein [Candidatus Acidoferrum sp.]